MSTQITSRILRRMTIHAQHSTVEIKQVASRFKDLPKFPECVLVQMIATIHNNRIEIPDVSICADSIDDIKALISDMQEAVKSWEGKEVEE